MLSDWTTLTGLAVALAGGLLVGLDREQANDHDEFGGIRTFPLISLAGALTWWISNAIGGWFVGVSFLALAGWIAVYYASQVQKRQTGLTSEIAALLAFFCGILAMQGEFGLSFALSIAITAILSLKERLHSAVKSLSREDLTATLKFLVIAFVLLPLLPTETWELTLPANTLPASLPQEELVLEMLTPSKVGWMVVLIAGISFVGFVAGKWMEERRGLGLTAFLGGLVSSTAVTLSFANKAKRAPVLLNTCVAAILLASTTMFIRVLVEVGAVAPSLLPSVLVPIGGMGIVCALSCAVFWKIGEKPEQDEEDPSIPLTNPFELKEAIRFGALFALVLFIASAAQTLFGQEGLYLSSVLAGLTDVDAITLTAAQLTLQDENPITHDTAAQAIALAVVSNTVVKGFLALSAGGAKLGLRVWIGFGLTLLTGLILSFLF